MGFWMVKSQNWLRLDHLCTGKYILNHSNISFSIRFFFEKKNLFFALNRKIARSNIISHLKSKFNTLTNQSSIENAVHWDEIDKLWQSMILRDHRQVWVCFNILWRCGTLAVHTFQCRVRWNLCAEENSIWKKKCNQINEIFVPVKIRMLLICWRHEIST